MNNGMNSGIQAAAERLTTRRDVLRLATFGLLAGLSAWLGRRAWRSGKLCGGLGSCAACTRLPACGQPQAATARDALDARPAGPQSGRRPS